MIETLAELICCASDKFAAAALFVLMGILRASESTDEHSNHFAFARCAESNLYSIVDAELAVVKSELLAPT